MAGGPVPYNRRNPAERAQLAEIIFDLKAQGLSFHAIDKMTQHPDGPTGGVRIAASTARDLVREEAERRVDPKIDTWRALVVERLEAAHERFNRLEEHATKVLERHHVTVSNGRVVTLNDEPLPDDGPVLQAIDRLVRIEAERERNTAALRRLFGLDMPVRVDATVTETTQQDLELQEMIRDAKAKVQLEEQQIIDGGAEG
jgi:DNA-binding transcriptional MerR regulator